MPSVTGLVGLCDLAEPSQSPYLGRFVVSEYAVLSNNDMILLRDGIGWTEEMVVVAEPGHASLASSMTPSDLVGRVLTVVIPDELDPEDGPHPWTRLARLARERGLADSSEQTFRNLNYTVWLSGAVLRWLEGEG